MALGASRWRIIRQLLTESMLLAIIGGVCGVLLAQWGVTLLVNLVARGTPLDTRPDAFVLLFTLGASVVAGILFGLIPAIQASRTNLSTAIKEKTRMRGSFLRFNLSSLMVVLQVGLSMVLLTGAGLFARSLMKLQSEDLGFDRSNMLLLGIDPRLAGYKQTELPALYQQIIDRVSTVPQVRNVSMATYAPLSGTLRSSSVQVTGYVAQPDEDLSVQDIFAGPKYAETLGIPLLRGRDIDVRDTASSPLIAVVNTTFAEHYFKDQNPIGRTFSFDDESDKGQAIQIVGVVGAIKGEDARKQPDPTIYRPILQVHDPGTYMVTVHVRTVSDPTPVTNQVRQMINQIDDKLPIFGVTTMNDQLRDNLDQERLIAQLVSFFGALALILACIGLYGVMAHGVARRTNEIGIRMALGARGSNIAWMILRETLYLVVAGLVIGVPAALIGARLVAAQLFGMRPTDPLTLMAAAVVLTLVALLAGYLPARRASRVNPLNALRYE
jgi:predicted permease